MVDDHRFPSKNNLFKNSACVTNDIAISPVKSLLAAASLLAVKVIAVRKTEDIRYIGGKESTEKVYSSHWWLS